MPKETDKPTLHKWIEKTNGTISVSNVEKIIGVPNGTLRHVRAGTRTPTPETYSKLKDIFLPELRKMVEELTTILLRETNPARK